MSQNNENIPFVSEDGEVVLFHILAQTMISGIRYLLVEEAGSEDGTVYIMKEGADDVGTGPEGDSGHGEQISFAFVEGEEELDSVMKVFELLLEETDLVKDY